jgi:hypothetical protein
MYKLCPLDLEGQQRTVKRITDSAYIPFDPDNSDYQEYLEWLEAGNEPIPADQPE